ncbi:MAG: ATP-binding protein [Caldimonas sp.]
MISRETAAEIRQRLAFYPGVVLLGPRQVGKTTLARAIAAERAGSLVLDLERIADRAQLVQPELFLAAHRSRLVVLDEVQFAPEIFASLRPEIDAARRPGRFLLLGSASGHLLRQQTESLAGRVSYLELGPLAASEVPADAFSLQRLWLRGGFPVSYLAPSDPLSYAWRQDFVETFLQRDLPALGVGVAAETLHRFWRMLAHLHGQLFNASQLGLSLGGASHTTAARYLDVLVDTMMVRRLEPHFVNLGKRLVKAPKIYVRDSGIVHALLGVASIDDLQSHPIAGASWEGFCVEQIHAHLPEGASAGFYRTAAGTELDVLVTTGKRRIGFEIKFSQAPKPTRGFWQALDDLNTTHAYIIAPVERRYPLARSVEVIPIGDVSEVLAS